MPDYITPNPYTADDSFHEIRFPESISYGVQGGPQYSTDVVRVGKTDYRNINWENGLCKYDAAHGVKSPEDIDDLIAFFRCRKGQGYGFRFKDWADFKAYNQMLGTVDVVPCSMQLVKRYESGGEVETRRIRKPVANTVYIYAAGKMITTGFTINYKSGAVTFTDASLIGKLITTDFDFDVPVRFASDYIPTCIESYNLHTMDNIPLIEDDV